MDSDTFMEKFDSDKLGDDDDFFGLYAAKEVLIPGIRSWNLFWEFTYKSQNRHLKINFKPRNTLHAS